VSISQEIFKVNLTKKHTIIGLSAVFGGIAWVVDSVVDWLFFSEQEEFWDILIYDIGPFEMYIHLIIFFLFLGFGVVLSLFYEKSRQADTRSEQRANDLAQFIKTANAPIFGIDAEGRVNEWNQTSEEITGFKKEEVLGKDLVQGYITEEYQGAVKEVLDDALKGQERSNYEFPLFTKDGRRVMVLLNSSTRRNPAGEIVGVLGVGQDITEIDALRTASESIAKELRQFIETANAPIFGIDAEGRVNEWNQTSEEITGFKKEEVLGKDLVQGYITEEYQGAVKEVLDDALKGQERSNYEFPLFTKNGRRVMVLLNSSTRRNSAGEIIGVLGVGQDITEIDTLRTALNEYKEDLESKVEIRTQELEASLEREKELGVLKSRFVTMASHEFRTPLTTINANSDIILRYFDKMSQDDIVERLGKIKNEVEEMAIMLEDILIIGKSDAQKLEYNPELLDIVSLIKDIITDYQLSESQSRTIIYDLSSPIIMVTADEKWIKHIIINLLTNAVKYSGGDQQIDVSIKEDQAGISFSVKDYGIGIAKEDIKLLFEPFYRGNNVSNIAGTGLGLVVLQKALDLHKGKIEVESEIGKGSIFTVILPITQ
jgi:PAS domain S-box-containing protein